MAKMGHDEVMGRVLDLLADVCGDDAAREHPTTTL